MDSLSGRTALLTGASRGLGRYMARALAAEGVSLALAAAVEVDLLAPMLLARYLLPGMVERSRGRSIRDDDPGGRRAGAAGPP